MLMQLYDSLMIGGRLVVENVGEWTFDEREAIFVDELGNINMISLSEDFSKNHISLYVHHYCVLGVEPNGSLLWQFHCDGRIEIVGRILDREDLSLPGVFINNVYVHEPHMIYVCEYSVFVFQEAQYIWKKDFVQEGGVRFDTLTIDQNGIAFENIAGEHRLYRWKDGTLNSHAD